MDTAIASYDKQGVVVSTNQQASDAGAEVLDQGGNAFDAACAALITQCVTEPGYVCLGGEIAALSYHCTGRNVNAISGVGMAPGDPMAIDRYYDERYFGTGILSAATPAIVHFCSTLLIEFGTRSFECVAQAALKLAEGGRPSIYWDSSRRKTIHARSGKPAAEHGETDNYEEAPWSVDLAKTLRELILSERQCCASREKKLEAVRECFHRGRIAEQLCDWYRSEGGRLAEFDLATQRTIIEPAVSTTIAGASIFKCGPWTQGPWVLQALQMLSRIGISDMRRFPERYFHFVIEATTLASADLNRYFGDPRFSLIPLDELLSTQYVDIRSRMITEYQSLHARAGDPINLVSMIDDEILPSAESGGTTTCITRDRWGNTVVMSPSGCGSTAGSGGVTGVIHGTRMLSFTLLPNHPNRLDLHKRPLMTPSPTMVLQDGEPILAFAATGGPRQDQLALQVVLEFLFGPVPRNDLSDRFLLQNAVFLFDKKTESGPKTLVDISPNLTDIRPGLTRRGHKCFFSKLDMDTLSASVLWQGDNRGEWLCHGPAVGHAGNQRRNP